MSTHKIKRYKAKYEDKENLFHKTTSLLLKSITCVIMFVMGITTIKEHFSKSIDYLLVAVVSIVIALCCILGVFSRLESKAYDFMLGLTRNTKTANNLVLVEIDNESISEIGDWPWTRDILGDALIRMKELGVKKAIFDIEYISPSSASLNKEAEKQKNEIFETEAQNIKDVVSQMTDAIAKGYYSTNELPELSKMMIDEYITPSISTMQNATEKLVRDNDDYFSKCLGFFGDSWLTINIRDMGIERSENEIEYVKSRFLYGDDFVKDPLGLIKKGNKETLKEEIETGSDASKEGFTTTIDLLMRGAHGAGFTNAFIDADGTRRRIELLSEKDGKYTPQLAFAPLCEYLGVESIERSKTSIILKNAIIPNKDGSLSEKRGDIKIPLDHHGRMLINWFHSVYKDSFNGQHESIQFLYKLDRMEKNIAAAFSILSGLRVPDEYGNDMEYYSEANTILEYSKYLMRRRTELLDGFYGFDEYGSTINANNTQEEDIKSFFLEKEEYFSYVEKYINAKYLDSIISMLDFYNDGTNSEYIESWKTRLSETFDTLESEYEQYKKDFESMKKVYENSICFIGFTASASTDFGVMPFDKTYANLGTHVNVANTIIQQDFIRPIAEWKGVSLLLLFAFALSLVVTLLSHNLSPDLRNNTGLIYVIVPTLIGVISMVFFKVYIPVVLTAAYCALLYIAELIYNFASVEGDKKFLQTTFGAYVAPAVVDQIVKNPNVAKLGGKSENLTALFSDVATFSGFTETINNEELERTKKENAALPPEEQKSTEEVAALGAARGAERLVAVLNDYLGVLSDAIMDAGGTIDKYVGDEIVSFFGAPIPDKNNAFNACVAGIRMLQAEAKYNEENKDRLPTIKENGVDTGKPFFLHSRVGLNTGSMVVGNMGTTKKLNYTIMGNNVNLASRLEGTNKVYGSWIMVSESTWLEADSGENKGKLVARAFDAVRVINVKKPVRIYNIIGLRNELSEQQIKATEIFNQGMEWYMKGSDTPKESKDPEDLKKAYELYKEAAELYPDDKSSEYFMSRCETFLSIGLPSVWDGVFTMKTK